MDSILLQTQEDKAFELLQNIKLDFTAEDNLTADSLESLRAYVRYIGENKLQLASVFRIGLRNDARRGIHHAFLDNGAGIIEANCVYQVIETQDYYELVPVFGSVREVSCVAYLKAHVESVCEQVGGVYKLPKISHSKENENE